MSDVQHITKFNPDGSIDGGWQLYYPQTDEFWAGDANTRVASGYYGWGGKSGRHDYYGFSNKVLLNVEKQVDEHHYGGVYTEEMVSLRMVLSGVTGTIDLSPSYPYAATGSIVVTLNNNRLNVYSRKYLESVGMTWEEMVAATRNILVFREVYESEDSDRVIGIEPSAPVRYGEYVIRYQPI